MVVKIFGDSHTSALKGALKESHVDSNARFDVQWVKLGKFGDVDFEEALEQVKELGSNDLLVISIWGTLHNVFGLLKQDPPFSFYAEKLEGPGELIPTNTLKAFFKKKIESNKRVIKLIKAANCKVVHLSTPPPKREQDFLLELASRKSTKYRDMEINSDSLNSPSYRLGLWKFEMETLASCLATHDVELMDVPVETVDEDGFLKSEFYDMDFTHANIAYGKEVIKMLEGFYK